MSTRQARAEALIEEAARASGYKNASALIDEVVYNAQAGSLSFWVTAQGKRIIVVDPGTFGKTRAGQLIAGAHEVAHAEHFAEVLAKTGNLQTARSAFFVPRSTIRYAIREAFTEELARLRVETFLGGLSPQQSADSTKYINFWLRRARAVP